MYHPSLFRYFRTEGVYYYLISPTTVLHMYSGPGSHTAIHVINT